MELDEIARGLPAQLETGSWWQVMGFLDAAVEAIDAAVREQPEGAAVDAAANDIAQKLVLNAEQPASYRGIAAELLGRFLVEPRTPVVQTLEQLSDRGFSVRPWARPDSGAGQDDASVNFVLGRKIASAAYGRTLEQRRDALDLPNMSASANDERLTAFWWEHFALPGELFSADRNLNLLAPGANVVVPRLADIGTHWGLTPGDVLFRRQTKTFWNPFRDFGHAAIYVGMLDRGADPLDCRNHAIIQVMNAAPACELASLHDLCHPGGHPEQFWGGYHVDMPAGERQKLLDVAFKLVGTSTYHFTKGYKNPGAFTYRCDGFVEHCFEAIGSSTPPLAHRGGLFEEDTYLRLNPVALRSCLPVRVVQHLGGCYKADMLDPWLKPLRAMS